MALSLAAGVAFATVLTLVLVPSLLVILNDFRILVHRMKHCTWPNRIDVEPARNRHVDLMGPEKTATPLQPLDRSVFRQDHFQPDDK